MLEKDMVGLLAECARFFWEVKRWYEKNLVGKYVSKPWVSGEGDRDVIFVTAVCNISITEEGGELEDRLFARTEGAVNGLLLVAGWV